MPFEAYFKCKFNKQGASKGTSPKTQRKDWIPVLAYNAEIVSPRDVATGQSAGKRTYKPIRFLHEWDAATPQLWTAVARNEQVDSAWFEFIKIDKTGNEYVYHKVTLTNATISNVSQFLGGDDAAGGEHGSGSSKDAGEAATLELERVSLTFQKIEMENVDGKTMFADDWNSVLT